MSHSDEARLFESYHRTRVVVLGASGFIGRWVAKRLCQAGAELFLLVRHPQPACEVFRSMSVGGEVVQLNLATDADRLGSLLSKICPSITFNLAGYGVEVGERDSGTAYQINAELLTTLSAAVARPINSGWKAQHLVHAGSALEYGDVNGDLSEESPTNPTTLYGQSKLAGTVNLANCSRQLGLRAMTARLFTVYGPGEHERRLLPELIRSAESGTNLRMTLGLQERDFTYVEDVAEGLLRIGLVRDNNYDVVNLASGRLTSVRDFAEAAARILRIPSERLQFGAIRPRPEEMSHLPVRIARLEQLLKWKPDTGIYDGIRKTLQYREQVRTEPA